MQETEKSICFYNSFNVNKHHDLLQNELKKLKCIIGDNDIKSDKSSLKWSDFMQIEARRAFAIGLLLVVLNQFCGIFAMLSYAVKIFEESGSSLSPVTSTIIVATIQLIGSYTPTILADRLGRKVRKKIKFSVFLTGWEGKCGNFFPPSIFFGTSEFYSKKKKSFFSFLFSSIQKNHFFSHFVWFPHIVPHDRVLHWNGTWHDHNGHLSLVKIMRLRNDRPNLDPNCHIFNGCVLCKRRHHGNTIFNHLRNDARQTQRHWHLDLYAHIDGVLFYRVKMFSVYESSVWYACVFVYLCRRVFD